MRLFALAGTLLALVGFTFAASAQRIDTNTYCTDGKQLLWRPPGGDLVPVSKFKLEQDVGLQHAEVLLRLSRLSR
jgi:hypothetical protein